MDSAKVRQVLIITLILNWLVAAAKIFIGFTTGALSILTDGFHSLFDGASNIIGLIGVKLAEKPKDEDHPYGHRKFESMATMAIAVLIITTGYEFLKNTIERLTHPFSPEITVLSFLVILGALAVDYFAYRYESSWGKRLKSSILTADSIHTKTHLFIGPAVLLAMVVIRAGFPIIDPIIAFFVIFALAKLALEIIKETTATLCDQAPIDIQHIKKITDKVDGVESSHQIRTRGGEHHVFLDMHITLNPNLSLDEAHNISHILKQKIMKEMPQIKDAVIHIEPGDKK